MIPPIVSAEWVAARRDELLLADVRWYLDGRSARDEYEAGHIAGAIRIDLDEDLSAPPGPDARHGRHPLPAPRAFAEAMSRRGIGDADTVVAYDDVGGAIAARLVWMLRVTGHDAALLDGGLAAWPEPLATGRPRRPPAEFNATDWPPDMLATADQAAAPDSFKIDGRDRSRYLGGPDPADPRSGHIPGAVSLPAGEKLDRSGRFRTPRDLAHLFQRLGVTTGEEVVSYCGSGVTACHTLLALEHAGLNPGRLYAGSWSEWSRDPSRPLETEDRNPPGV